MLSNMLSYVLDALRLTGEAHCVQLERAWGDQWAWRRSLRLYGAVRPREERP